MFDKPEDILPKEDKNIIIITDLRKETITTNDFFELSYNDKLDDILINIPNLFKIPTSLRP